MHLSYGESGCTLSSPFHTAGRLTALFALSLASPITSGEDRPAPGGIEDSGAGSYAYAGLNMLLSEHPTDCARILAITAGSTIAAMIFQAAATVGQCSHIDIEHALEQQASL
jgi:hypothetical protein